MALAKIGKFYHIKYRDLSGMPRSRTTGKTVKAEAAADERVWMAQLKAERKRRKHGDFLEAAANVDRMVAVLDGTKRRNRLKLTDALDRYRALYGEPSAAAAGYFKRFCRNVSLKYMDEVSPAFAADYLYSTYEESAKSFNEAKIGLNVVFRRLLVYAGLTVSPFSLVANRKHAGEHQRALSDDEIRRIIEIAPEPLRAAVEIAWYTGFRGSSCINFRWAEIMCDAEHSGRYIKHKPPKTARHNRAVEIPVHPKLENLLTRLPIRDEYVLGFAPSRSLSNFMAVCRSIGICDNADGIVRFGSIRKNFIERCDAAGLRRTATRGMAGHTEDDITDIYSIDFPGTLAFKETPGLYDNIKK